jgi:hypothetical protein
MPPGTIQELTEISLQMSRRQGHLLPPPRNPSQPPFASHIYCLNRLSSCTQLPEHLIHTFTLACFLSSFLVGVLRCCVAFQDTLWKTPASTTKLVSIGPGAFFWSLDWIVCLHAALHLSCNWLLTLPARRVQVSTVFSTSLVYCFSVMCLLPGPGFVCNTHIHSLLHHLSFLACIYRMCSLQVHY